MLSWDDDRMVGFDFETSGTLPEYALQPWRVAQGTAWPTSLVLTQKTPTGFISSGGLNPTRKSMKMLLEEAVDNKSVMVGWNTVFDIAWFLAYGLEDLVNQLTWLDGLLMWRHWFLEPEYSENSFNKKSYGLKACVAEHLPDHAGYEQDIDFHDPDPAVRAQLHRYNIKDTIFTLFLARRFFMLLASDPRRLQAMLIEARCLPMVAAANLQGMVVDTFAARELQSHLVNTAAERLEVLAPYGVTEKVVRSPSQLANLLFDDWGLPVLKENTGKKTGKKTRSTDKEVLYELAFQDERAQTLREYREALNNKTKFADAPLASAEYNGDGITRPSAIVFGTYSGRLTYASKQGRNKGARQTGFALHQEKRGTEYRSVIVAPPGYTLMEFDASGQEFRWMAIASGDETMLSLCLPGEDAHTYMGSQITHVDYQQMMRDVSNEVKTAKNSRQLGKVANLSLQYRTSAPKLRTVARVQYGLPLEMPEAGRIHATYRRVYKDVPVYWDTQIAQTKKDGYVETFAGRRVQVKGNWNGTWGWSMGSTAINYRIQGTGADQKYLAMAVLEPYLQRHGIIFAWDLHDGLYFYVPDEKVSRAARDMRYLLNNLPYRQAWGFSPPIGLPWDCKSGHSWGSLKEYRYD